MELEEWRALAETVPGTYLAIAVKTFGGLLVRVDSAHRMLGAVVRTLRTLPAGPGEGKLGGAFPRAVLEGALPLLARLEALHAGAGYVYDLYARRALEHANDEPSYKSWQDHMRDAVFGAGHARQRLRHAASEARATEAALRLFRSFPRGSLGWVSWRNAARRLAQRAAFSAALAFYALWRLHDAVVLEFYVFTKKRAASMIIDRSVKARFM